jgi:E3 ubiquitin-protein ligase HUWE1
MYRKISLLSTLAYANVCSFFLQNVTKSVGLLDSIVYGFAASFSAFCNAGGLDSLVNRIKVCF